MGPLTLLDFVGLDTTYYIANIMFDEFKERRFAPPPLLKRMVMAGMERTEIRGARLLRLLLKRPRENPKPVDNPGVRCQAEKTKIA